MTLQKRKKKFFLFSSFTPKLKKNFILVELKPKKTQINKKIFIKLEEYLILEIINYKQSVIVGKIKLKKHTYITHIVYTLLSYTTCNVTKTQEEVDLKDHIQLTTHSEMSAKPCRTHL